MQNQLEQNQEVSIQQWEEEAFLFLAPHFTNPFVSYNGVDFVMLEVCIFWVKRVFFSDSKIRQHSYNYQTKAKNFELFCVQESFLADVLDNAVN